MQNGSYRMMDGVKYLCRPRDYAVSIIHTGVVNTSASNAITIDPAASFLLCDRFMEDTADTQTAIAPGILGQYENLIQIQDASTNYNWSNNPIPRSAFARDRAHGYRQTSETLIQANTKLNITITEPPVNAAAGTMTIVLQGLSLSRA